MTRKNSPCSSFHVNFVLDPTCSCLHKNRMHFHEPLSDDHHNWRHQHMYLCTMICLLDLFRCWFAFVRPPLLNQMAM